MSNLFCTVTIIVFSNHFDKYPQQIGKYKIEELLGEGSFGMVLLGSDETIQNDDSSKKLVAIKILKNTEERFQDEAKREFNLLQPLRHRYVVECLEALEHDGAFCTVIQYANNGDLGRFITRKRNRMNSNQEAAWSPQDISEWYKQITGGITFLHDQKVMHRDLKPANVVIHKQ